MKVARPYRLKLLVISTFLVLGLALFSPTQAQARGFDYPNYNVELKVNPDSTVDVTETLTYDFNGEFRGVFRQITLEDRGRDQYCESTGLTCGGFDRIALLGVFDSEGRKLDADEYELFIESNEDTGKSYYSIKWEVWPGGQNHNHEIFTWTIKYRLYGSIGWIGADASSADPYLYWNMLPEGRGGSIDESIMKIILPPGTTADSNILEAYNDYGQTYSTSASRNEIEIRVRDLPNYGDFTLAYRIPRESVQFPGVLSYGGIIPMVGVGVMIDGVDMGDIGGRLHSMPIGTHELEFYRSGYNSMITEVTVSSGQETAVTVNLDPGILVTIAIIVSLVLNFVGLILIPAGLFWVYIRWQTKGQDINPAKSIFPIFQPPEGVEPYMLGSLKDEVVDREDVTGTIIDLAYRGFIKIKELKKDKDYELFLLEGKPGGIKPNDFEQKLLDNLFGNKTSVKTKKLGDKFASKYLRLVEKAYKEMVTRGYFTEKPNLTRQKYAALGVGLIVAGSIFGFGLGFLWLEWVGVLGPILIGFAGVFTGVAQIVVANYMPAKTAKGSRILAKIEGFRMYLHHAERYRLQDLTPEEFEKYLSYAIVFGIEKSWANSFKDIYKGQPEWFETDRNNIVWDTIWLSRFSRSFSNSMNRTVYKSLPKGTGSASGSGWSGGSSSFGGFSGGGGGGGFSGAF